MSAVGKNVARLDGVDKVTGRALYTDDISLPDMWHGVVVRSTIPHGKVAGISLDPSFDWTRVVSADSKDIPGKNCVAMIEEDVPLIVSDVTKHVGEAILLIAAPTRELALEARSHVCVSYEEYEPIFSIEDAKSSKIKIHGSDNIISQYKLTKGDIKSGLNEADEIVEGHYSMGHQEHMYIEPQSVIAKAGKDGSLSVIGSIQCPYYVSKAMSILLGIPQEKISVRQAAIGGAFGGKEDYPSVLAGYAAVLSKKAGRPVKIILDRAEDTEVTTKRHPAAVSHRTGVKKDGTITAMEIKIELDAGAYVTMSPVVLSRATLHSAGPYRCENISIDSKAYATNMPPNGAFRGFGAPQVFFPLEVQMDRVAEKIGMSPLEFRMKNRLRVGDLTATGQLLKESVGATKVLEAAAKNSDFKKRHKFLSKNQDKRIRRGIGLSFFMHGAGFTGSGEAYLKGKAGLRLDDDGKISILTACTEMGQGSHTVLPQMAADHLGVDISLIRLETPDTAKVPNSGPTVASRTTMVMGSVLGKCAEKLKKELFKFASEKFRVDAKRLKFQNDSIVVTITPLLCKEGQGEVDQDLPHLNPPLTKGRKNSNKLTTVSELIKMYLKDCGPLTVIDQYTLPPGHNWDDKTYKGDAYPAYAWGCDVAEVEVDMDTFEVRVVKMWLVQDIGRAINPKLAEGQIEGGTLQSVGWALMEHHLLDHGHFKTNKFQTYIIPTSLDAPDMKTIIVEEPFSFGPMGAKGLGELPMDGGAPAIANAIAHAIGVRMRDLPMTPEKIYQEFTRQKIL